MTTYSAYIRTPSDMKILAIDPGFDRLGIAVVSGTASNPEFIYGACVIPKPGKLSERLTEVFLAVDDAVKKHKPDIVAVETLFFSVNKKTALNVAHARGAILVAASINNVQVTEYSPQEVKMAVTGYGNAGKKAVANMVEKLIVLPKQKRLDDEIDAIAIGITALAEGYPHLR